MNAKDEASPKTRVTMEQRWRDARAACEAGTCDPGEKKFHRSGCTRKGAGDMDINERTNDRLRKDDGNGVIPPGLVEFDTEGRQSGGWIGPAEVVYGSYGVPLVEEVPAVKVPRKGLRWPVTALEHVVKPVRDHWWSKKYYEVWTSVRGSASPAIWMGLFRTPQEAKELCADLDKLNLEINRRRDQIDDAN